MCNHLYNRITMQPLITAIPPSASKHRAASSIRIGLSAMLMLMIAGVTQPATVRAVTSNTPLVLAPTNSLPCVPPSTTYVDDDWAGASIDADPDGAGPATQFGCDSFATVQGGVSGVTTGGNVIVASGNYIESQVNITKSVAITGAGPATTIIDGQNLPPPTDGLVRIEPLASDAGTVIFSGFTVINPGSNSTRVGMLIKPLNTSAMVTVTNNIIAGGNNSDYGIYLYRNRGTVIFTGNVITNTGYNGVLIEQPIGATEVSSNTINVAGSSASYFQMTYGSQDVTTTQRVAYNTFNGPFASAIAFNPSPVFVSVSARYGKYTRVEIVGNTITNLGAGRTGIALLNDTSDVTGAAGAVENPIIMSNTITSTNAASSNGIYLRGLVTNANIRGNDIRNLARSLTSAVANTHYATGASANFNNFVNNSLGIVWNITSTVNTENNWWGCNDGPGATGCDAITGTFQSAVDYTPWIVLNATMTPNPITPFGTATITVDMTQNSTPAPAGGTTPDTTVIFTATEGTVPSPGTIVAGTASALLTSTSGNSGIACVTVDNESICTTVIITASVGLTKQASAAAVSPGDAITYTLTFSNAGPGTANDVIISDSVPSDITITGVFSSGANITQTSGSPNFVWSLGNLTAGSSGVITLTGVVSNNQSLIGTTLTNTAGITASNDTDNSNNDAAAAVQIVALPNLPPTANAGAPQTVYVGTQVTLNGSGSSDPEHQTLTFGWSQVSGSPVVLSDASAAAPTFTAPIAPGELVFQLIVTDSGSLSSAPALVTITVQAEPINVIPPDGLQITVTTSGDLLQPTKDFTATLITGTHPITFVWNFGDGSPLAHGQAVSHIYAPGAYTVTVTATNSAGSVTSTTHILVPYRVFLAIVMRTDTLSAQLE